VSRLFSFLISLFCGDTQQQKYQKKSINFGPKIREFWFLNLSGNPVIVAKLFSNNWAFQPNPGQPALYNQALVVIVLFVYTLLLTLLTNGRFAVDFSEIFAFYELDFLFRVMSVKSFREFRD